MANESGIVWGSEIYLARIFALNQDTGAILAPSTAPYTGLELYYPRAFDLNIPDARLVANTGQGRVTDVMYHPPLEPDRAVLRVGRTQHDVFEVLTGVKQVFEGERSTMQHATDRRGNEKIVAMLLEQKGKNFQGLNRWRYYIIPRATVVFNNSSYNPEATEILYNVVMSACLTTLWGRALSMATDGCLSAGYADGMSGQMYQICAWLTDGYTDEFAFPTNQLPTNATRTKVYNFTDAGAVVAGTVAVDFTTFTATALPDANKVLIASYE